MALVHAVTGEARESILWDMSVAECHQYIIAGRLLKGEKDTWPDQEDKEKAAFMEAFRNRAT